MAILGTRLLDDTYVLGEKKPCQHFTYNFCSVGFAVFYYESN